MSVKLQTFFDFGGFFSSLLLGPMLMRYKICGKKVQLSAMFICFVVCCVTIPVFFGFTRAVNRQNEAESSSKAELMVYFSLLGCLLGFPDSLYSGIAAVELAKYDGRGLEGSLAGFINGFGGF